MVTVGSYLYISSGNTIFKTDKNLNSLDQYNNSNAIYHGLYYDCTSNILYLCNEYNRTVDLFDLNFVLSENISLPYSLQSIAGYNNTLYIGAFETKICAIFVKKVIKYYDYAAFHGSRIASILFDKLGYIAYIYFRIKFNKLLSFEPNNHEIYIEGYLYSRINSQYDRIYRVLFLFVLKGRFVFFCQKLQFTFFTNIELLTNQIFK